MGSNPGVSQLHRSLKSTFPVTRLYMHVTAFQATRTKCCRNSIFRERLGCSPRSGFGLPVQDEVDGRGRPLVRGEIDQESLAIRRHGVLLLSNAWHGTAGNANREQ